MHGHVGAGKTMLMDLLYESTRRRPRRRLHFHALMVEVHTKLHEAHAALPRRIVLTEQGLPIYKFGDESPDATHISPLASAVAALVEPHSLLCLDEMQVTDVADAMLLRQTFEQIFARGVRVVFTSNTPPELLYARGLNRKYFEPFVELIRTQCLTLDVGMLADGSNEDGGSSGRRVDYRALPPLASPATPLPAHCAQFEPRRPGGYYAGDTAASHLWDAWKARDLGMLTPLTLPVAFRRSLNIAGGADGAAWLDFAGVCGKMPGEAALGAADYLALASGVRNVFLANVPVLSAARRDEARRLVLLIDALYDARIGLFVGASVPLDLLFAPLLAATQAAADDTPDTSTDGTFNLQLAADGELVTRLSPREEAFMLDRTISRLRQLTRDS